METEDVSLETEGEETLENFEKKMAGAAIAEANQELRGWRAGRGEGRTRAGGNAGELPGKPAGRGRATLTTLKTPLESPAGEGTQVAPEEVDEALDNGKQED